MIHRILQRFEASCFSPINQWQTPPVLPNSVMFFPITTHRAGPTPLTSAVMLRELRTHCISDPSTWESGSGGSNLRAKKLTIQMSSWIPTVASVRVSSSFEPIETRLSQSLKLENVGVSYLGYRNHG